MERQHNNLLQAAKQIQSLYGNKLSGKIFANQTDINVLKRAMATMQHHDAVTGTEKQHVAEDYAMRLNEGSKAVQSFLGPILFDKAGTPSAMGANNFLCPLTNISQCHWTDFQDWNLNILVYNPLTRPVSKMVRFPVTEANVQVFDGNKQEIPVEFIPIGSFILDLPGRESSANYDAIFLAQDIPPLGNVLVALDYFHYSIIPLFHFRIGLLL